MANQKGADAESIILARRIITLIFLLFVLFMDHSQGDVDLLDAIIGLIYGAGGNISIGGGF